jgi:hypothetical protein
MRVILNGDEYKELVKPKQEMEKQVKKDMLKRFQQIARDEGSAIKTLENIKKFLLS